MQRESPRQRARAWTDGTWYFNFANSGWGADWWNGCGPHAWADGLGQCIWCQASFGATSPAGTFIDWATLHIQFQRDWNGGERSWIEIHHGCGADCLQLDPLICNNWGWAFGDGDQACWFDGDIGINPDTDTIDVFAQCAWAGGCWANNWFYVLGSDFLIQDTTVPTSTGAGGTLLGGGWLSGTKTATWNANDNTGARRVEVWINSPGWTMVQSFDYGCNYNNMAPCANQVPCFCSGGLLVNTTAVADGASLPVIYRTWDATNVAGAGTCCDGGGTWGNLGDWTGTINIDNNPPNTPPLVSPAAAATTNNTTPTLTATYQDAGAPGQLSFRIGTSSTCGTSVVQTGTSAAGLANGANGNWTPAALAQGTYYWCAMATDGTSKTSAWSATRQLIVDTGPPSVPALVTPIDGAVTSSTTPMLSATYTDNTVVTNGQLSFRIGTNATCGTSVVQTGTSAAGLVSGTNGNWTPAALAQGTYYWCSMATDAGSNTSAWSATRQLIVDTAAPPVPTLVSPAAGAITSSTTPMLTATYNDGASPGQLSFRIGTNATCGTSVVQTGTSAAGIAPGTNGNWTPAALAQGTYYWCAMSTDGVPNTSAWSATRQLIIDTGPPNTPLLVTPANGSATNDTTPTLTATYTDTATITNGQLSLRIGTSATCGTSVVQTGTSAAGLVSGANGNWTPAALAQGTYYWCAMATDGAGNTSAWSGTWQLTVDTGPPSVPPLVSPAGGSTTSDTTPTLTATYNDNAIVTSGQLSFRIGTSATCGTAVVQTGASDPGIASGTDGNWTPAALGLGTYYWCAMATDDGGNISAWSATRQLVIGTPSMTIGVDSGTQSLGVALPKGSPINKYYK